MELLFLTVLLLFLQSPFTFGIGSFDSAHLAILRDFVAAVGICPFSLISWQQVHLLRLIRLGNNSYQDKDRYFFLDFGTIKMFSSLLYIRGRSCMVRLLHRIVLVVGNEVVILAARKVIAQEKHPWLLCYCGHTFRPPSFFQNLALFKGSTSTKNKYVGVHIVLLHSYHKHRNHNGGACVAHKNPCAG